MQIHFQASESFQGLFDFLYQCRSDASVSLTLVDCQRVDPAAVSVVSTHHGADYPVVLYSDQEQIGVAGGLLLDG